MAKFEFKLPDIGEGVTEGEIVNWLVKVGDSLASDQDMVEVMTDKATVTIGSPKAGTVTELRGKVGDVVPVGNVMIVLEVSEGAAPSIPAASATPAPATASASASVASAPAPTAVPQASPEDSGTTAVGDIREQLPGMSAPAAGVVAAKPAAGSAYFNDKPLAAPATRKYAREVGVDIRQVSPSGAAGRITREDIERFGQAAPSAPGPAVAAVAPPVAAGQPVPRTVGDERVPIRGMRKRIYENMARSKHTAAHFTYVDECDATELKALRERSKRFAERAQVRLTFLPFIVKAVVAALKRHPELNCLVDDSAMEMVLKRTYDIGIATSTDAGLIVPVVRNADRLSILEIAKEIDRLALNAKESKTLKEDLGGSSFTITSLGKLGGLFATPVINYPEVAILGIHEMKRKPVVRGEQIVIGDVMLLSLSFDHRIVDGHIGAAFAQTIIEYLQEPDRLLVEMG